MSNYGLCKSKHNSKRRKLIAGAVKTERSNFSIFSSGTKPGTRNALIRHTVRHKIRSKAL